MHSRIGSARGAAEYSRVRRARCQHGARGDAVPAMCQRWRLADGSWPPHTCNVRAQHGKKQCTQTQCAHITTSSSSCKTCARTTPAAAAAKPHLAAQRRILSAVGRALLPQLLDLRLPTGPGSDLCPTHVSGHVPEHVPLSVLCLACYVSHVMSHMLCLASISHMLYLTCYFT